MKADCAGTKHGFLQNKADLGAQRVQLVVGGLDVRHPFLRNNWLAFIGLENQIDFLERQTRRITSMKVLVRVNVHTVFNVVSTAQDWQMSTTFPGICPRGNN